MIKPGTPGTNAEERKPTPVVSQSAAANSIRRSAGQAKPGLGQSRERQTRSIYQPDRDGRGQCRLRYRRQALPGDRPDQTEGLVRSESGYIAVVVNAANRAYFLRENDPLHERLRNAHHGHGGHLQGEREGSHRQVDDARSDADNGRADRIARQLIMRRPPRE